MLVKDLIAELQKCNPNAPVQIQTYELDDYDAMRQVENDAVRISDYIGKVVIE